jgi:hypothetical protein
VCLHAYPGDHAPQPLRMPCGMGKGCPWFHPSHVQGTRMLAGLPGPCWAVQYRGSVRADLVQLHPLTLQRSHPSALKRLRVCQRVATVPDGCTSLRLAIDKPRPAPSPLCVACGADGARPAWRSTELSPAAGVRVRLGRAPSGDTGEVRGGAGGLA